MTELSYFPPSIDDLPTVFTSKKILRYVAWEHPFAWIQPESLDHKETTHPWGYYYEHIPHVEDPELSSGISIEITRCANLPSLLLIASAIEPGGHRRQMNVRRAYELSPTDARWRNSHQIDAYERLYGQVKRIAFDWLLEARLLMARALQVVDPEENLVLARIGCKEEVSTYTPSFTAQFVPERIADWCAWYQPGDARHRHGKPDGGRVFPHLQRLVQKQLLVERHGEFHTPEYLTDGVSVVLAAPVIPDQQWLNCHSRPQVIGNMRPAGSSGRTWLAKLLEDAIPPDR